jgi:threonine/homoserine/homoserine lactone efflux protein
MAYLLLGLSLGLPAGISPGPLLTLVVATSLRDGLRQGLLVAAAPFLSDLPIILLSIFVLNQLPTWTLSAIAIAGASYVTYLGWETIRSARYARLASEASTLQVEGDRRSLQRGALTNLLSPHPYLFWAMVGAPALLAALDRGPLAALAFLVGFYGGLVGSKAAIAALVHSQAHWLTAAWYRRILILLGILLIGLGLLLAWEAVLQVAGNR